MFLFTVINVFLDKYIISITVC